MRKLLSALLLSLLTFVPMAARDRITTNVNELPANAQATLNKYFARQKVNHIKIDKKSFGGNEYDVVLNNGTEIEFDKNGNWKEIDCGANKVPDGLILKPITNYIKNNFKGRSVISIEISRHKYEIKLSDGIELEFDRGGNFLRVDH